MIWEIFQQLWIYPVAAVAPILDGISTYLLLEYAECGEEWNPRVGYFHNYWGVKRGQALWTVFVALPLWVIGVYVTQLLSGLAATSLIVGVYLGIAIKQVLQGYSVYSQ